MGEVCQKIHNKLTGGKEKILLEYDRDVGYDSYLTELAKKRQKRFKIFYNDSGTAQGWYQFYCEWDWYPQVYGYPALQRVSGCAATESPEHV